MPHEDDHKNSDAQVLFYNVSAVDARKRGILETANDLRVTKFREKPQNTTEGQLYKACPAFYVFGPKALSLVGDYVEQYAGCLEKLDAPGQVLPWLLRHRAEVGKFLAD